MKYQIILIGIIFILGACFKKQEEKSIKVSFAKVVESKGSMVPADSVSDPMEIHIDKTKLRKTKVGVPKTVRANTNIYPVGNPKHILAGNAKIGVPGQNNYLLPKKKLAIDSPFLAGKPEVVIVKAPTIKDLNSQNFSSYSKIQGLKNGYIYCMYEDHQGNLWISTERGGVSRYNGKTLTNFTVKEGLPDDKAYSIVEDKKGNIWIGTYGGGLSRFDGRSFANFGEKEGLSSNNVTSLLVDKKGALWIGTIGGGVSMLMPNVRGSRDTFIHYSEKEGLAHHDVTSILQDRDGQLWFGTYGGGVSVYNDHFFANFTTAEGLSSNYIWKLAEDKVGNIWIGTDGQGVIKYDGKSFNQFTTQEGMSGNNVYTILEDKSGSIWFGTNGGGATKYNPGGEGSFTHYTEKEGLSQNIVYTILEDRNGNLWFGTYGGGISKFEGNLFTHLTEKEGLSQNMIYSILEDQEKNLWFGTGGGGVIRYNANTLNAGSHSQATFEHFTDKQGLSNNIINSILQDKKGNFWFGTDGSGLIHYVPENNLSQDLADRGTYTFYSKSDGLSSDLIRKILEDKLGNIWIGTFGGGIIKYDGKSFIQYSEKQGLCNNFVFTILEDKNGSLWIGTDGGGVSRYDPGLSNESGRFTTFNENHGFSRNMVRSIIEDRKSNLWFGTGDGIFKYDGLRFTHFNEKQGLSDNLIYSILEDKRENLWFGTRMGLSKLSKNKLLSFDREPEPDTFISDSVPGYPSSKDFVSPERYGLFTNYRYEEGFLGMGCYANSICEDKNGTIWIGANDRLTAYHPEGDQEDTLAPNIQLTSIELFNENINWMGLEHHQDTGLVLESGMKLSDFKFDGITKWYDLPINLNLNYQSNYLTFNYIGITLKSQNKVKYRYQLQGLDNHWSGLTGRSETSFGNLAPGAYNFRIKAMNDEGYWSDEYAYAFTIRPPWWLTFWAYGFYFLGILGSIYAYTSYRSAALKKQNKILERKVELRTNQLETSLENLKSTQAQLIQSEKMASLGELTAGIAHEIQNPLNFVNNFSELNNELVTELNDELAMGNEQLAKDNRQDVLLKIQSAIDIAKDLKENSEKINHHGKRAESIVKGMLEHSRKSNGVKELTDINKLCYEFMRLSYHGLRAKDAKFNCDYKLDLDPNLPLVNVVSQDIGRVILNIVNNAFQASAENLVGLSVIPLKDQRGLSDGQNEYIPLVSVSTKYLGDKIEISITDNGPGIPDHIKDKIFQPFFTTKPSGQGTGLGLSLAYDIVKAHGGEITVESKNGYGTEFIIKIPITL